MSRMKIEIKKLIEALQQQHPSAADKLPTFLNAEGITQSQVVLNGEAQNCPCAWGIVEQDAKWIFFEMDDERGYIWYSQTFDTIKETCDFAKEYFEPRLQMYDKRIERAAQVEELEQLVQARLPMDYRDFLINCNGDGFAVKDVSLTIEGVNEQIGIDAMFGFHEKRSLNLITWYQEYQNELPENAIIIGNSCGAGLLLLIWQEDWQGVFLWDDALVLESSTEEDCLYCIADSFKEFWKLLIRERTKNRK